MKADEIRRFVEKSSRLIIGISWDKNSRYNTRETMTGLEYAKLPIIVEKVVSRGKLIIIECHNVEKMKIYIVFHLGMSGGFTFGKENKEKHSNLWIEFGRKVEEQEYYEETSRFYFTDPRKFGSCTIYNDLTELFKKNGPCLLSMCFNLKTNFETKLETNFETKLETNFETKDKATRELWNEVLSNKRIQNKPICEFLLEQKYFSGVGNYIRIELMYRCKIHPNRKLKDLSEDDRNLLYDKTLEVIYQAWQTKGPSDGYIKGGHFKLQVYGQSVDPYGNEVQRYSDSKKRTVHFVPAVQKY